jgi:hypothetical protein
VVILIVFDPMKTWHEYLHRRLEHSTPLLPGYEHVALDYTELKRIHHKNRMCKIWGHLWEVESIVPSLTDTHPYTYYISCAACFPHIHSRRTYRTYNLFALSEKEQD